MCLRVVRRQIRVHMHQPAAHGLKAEPAADLVHRDIRLQLLLPPHRIRKKTELVRKILRLEMGYPDPYAADRLSPAVVLPEKPHRLLRDLLGNVGGHIDLVLPRKAAQIAVPDIDLDHITHKTVFPQAGSHALREHVDHHPDVLLGRQVPRRRSAVPYALDRHFAPVGGHRRLILPSREDREHQPYLSEYALKKSRVRLRQVPDGEDPVAQELPLRRPSHEQEVRGRALPDDIPVVVPVDHRNGVRLFVIGPEFRVDLVPADADAHRDPQLAPDPVRDPSRDVRPAPYALPALCAVDPALVQPIGFHLIRILPVDLSCEFGKAKIQIHPGGYDDQPGAGLPRLPQRRTGLHARPLRYIVGRQYDPVALLGIPSDCQRSSVQFRMMQHLHAGIKTVAV